MRWPWQRPIVEHRSYTDAVVTAILQSASGGSVRTALATAAVESCATLYAGALSSCAVSGPSTVTRALTADWRASVASGLVRNGQALYLIDADPSAGLALVPVSHWDVHGGPDVASWFYRCELAGPSTTAWRTRSAGAVLHLRWLVNNARPWAGVSPLQHAADTGSLAGWLERRLSEESSGPVGAFLPVAKYDADPDADLDADDADDPLAALRRDIGAARWQTLLVETAMAAARIVRPVHRDATTRLRGSARILRAIWSSCERTSHATSARRAASHAPYSTPRQVDKRCANHGGYLSRHRLTVSVVGSKRSCAYSWAWRCRLIPRSWAGAISWRGRPRSDDSRKQG